MSPPHLGSPNGTPIDRGMPRFQSPSQLSLRVPGERTCPFPEPYSPYTSRSQEKSPPNRALAKKVAPFSDPSKYLLKFPLNGLPRFPNGSLRREASDYRTFLHHPSKSPVNEPPSIFPYRVPLERESSSSETMVYSFIYYNCQSPQLRALPRKGENICFAIHGTPRVPKAYIQWGAWFTKGIVYDTALSTPEPCSLQHETFHLGLGRPEPY